MAERFVRTDAGRREIRERRHSLSRAARNLLLVIDASKPASDWLALVAGSTAADLTQLHDAGLIAAAGGDALRPALTLAQALQARSYRELYDLLTDRKSVV